jgi:hypothetical protein
MIFEKIQLEGDEVILKIVRRHWFYVFKQCAAIAASILFPLFTFLIVLSIAPEVIETLISTHAVETTYLYTLWLLLNWMMLASVWTEYYLDTWTITNKRIIKIDQISLFNRSVGSFRLERLQDINVEIRGIIATLLDFGTVHAQTASGNDEDFKAEYIPKPQEVKSIILKATDERITRSAEPSH